MELLLQNKWFWIGTIGVICVISICKWLWTFNKYIFMIVVAMLIAVFIIGQYQGDWLAAAWSNIED